MVLTWCLPAQAQEGTNLIPNGDLEEPVRITDDNVPYPMKPWSDVQDRAIARYSLAQDEKVSGENSLLIERVEQAGNARVSILSSKGLELAPNRKYRFSCQVKSTEGDAAVIIGFRNEAGEEVPVELLPVSVGAVLAGSGHNVLSLPRKAAENPDGWNELAVTFETPDTYLRIHLQASYSFTLGSAWFDDFVLREE